MRVRSQWFVLSGALGGLLGFALMEIGSQVVPGAGTRSGDILRMSIYFAGFGLAVGSALGMTEGAVQKKPGRLVYGLFMGLVLGAAGGFAGGAVGQTIYGLVPLKYAGSSNADLAIALDSSGSMAKPWFVFWNDQRLGHDPDGERRKAAKNLIDRLSTTDRVAVVDFDNVASVLYPLNVMDSRSARRAAKAAVNRINDEGGTDLSAGLDAGIEELTSNRVEGRSQFLIFLTDGEGNYDPSSAQRARLAGIKIYTIGLGSEINPAVLESIAADTNGRYYPVEDAESLTALFEQIFTENIDMTSRAGGKPAEAAEPLTSPIVLIILRILSWAVVGLAIGLGQGVRENTREDLRACALGGLLGGIMGGALFDPVTSLVSVGAGLAGRALADVVVGACIGGSMRLAQVRMVEARGKPTTTLLAILPEKRGSLGLHPSPRAPEPQPTRSPATAQVPWKPLEPQVPKATVGAERPSLSSFLVGEDRELAMARAYRAGYSLGEIAEQFGVPATAVKRAANQHVGR
ncbi:MAG: hypothetical protein QOH06_2474 [Acidobacteriota bacterium]|jgi:hypothetical protein|nr:hypothetical protein [Acidobacteriota bacterium]